MKKRLFIMVLILMQVVLLTGAITPYAYGQTVQIDMCELTSGNADRENSPNKVDFWDLQILLNGYDGVQGEPKYDDNATADFTLNGKIDFWDLQLLLSAYDWTSPIEVFCEDPA